MYTMVGLMRPLLRGPSQLGDKVIDSSCFQRLVPGHQQQNTARETYSTAMTGCFSHHADECC